MVNFKPQTSIKQTTFKVQTMYFRVHDQEIIQLVKVTNSYFPKNL